MDSDRSKANRRTAGLLSVVALAMVGFGYALVPLYDVFCEVTGLGGRTGQVSLAEAQELGAEVDSDRLVTVFLDANIRGLPWDFSPEVAKVRVRPGELSEVFYLASNTSDKETTGRAAPSVTPGAASLHFKKIECFCFTEQTLASGESRRMPVRFVVKPDMPDRLDSLALSYTFFNITDASSAKKDKV